MASFPKNQRNANLKDNLSYVKNDHYSWYKSNVHVSSTSDNMPILYFPQFYVVKLDMTHDEHNLYSVHLL